MTDLQHQALTLLPGLCEAVGWEEFDGHTVMGEEWSLGLDPGRPDGPRQFWQFLFFRLLEVCEDQQLVVDIIGPRMGGKPPWDVRLRFVNDPRSASGVPATAFVGEMSVMRSDIPAALCILLAQALGE